MVTIIPTTSERRDRGVRGPAGDTKHREQSATNVAERHENR